MVKWVCSSSLCYNNFRTRTSNGEILKTEGINWKSGHICCEHWSEGMKEDNNDLPNLTVPSTQIPIIKKICQKAKERYGKLKLPTNTDKLKLRVKK